MVRAEAPDVSAFTRWLSRKWDRLPDAALAESYRATFGTLHGQRVLQHLIDGAYATVYEGNDPVELAHHNGRRSFMHEVLHNIDIGEHPEKYRDEITTEAILASGTRGEA